MRNKGTKQGRDNILLKDILSSANRAGFTKESGVEDGKGRDNIGNQEE